LSTRPSGGKRIIQELLEFSRERKPQKASANLNSIVKKALSVVENEFRMRRIRVDKRLSTDIPESPLDANQLQQVLVNLLINAAEAIQENGTIGVYSFLGPDENTVTVEITDSGCGIPPEHMDRIFEPFFSSKEKGTGLGLAVSFGIVRNHRGYIEVSSQPGQGSCFSVTLQFLGAGPRSPPRSKNVTPHSILIIDDEPAISEGCRLVLSEAGHRVQACATGRTGLEAILKGPHDIALLDLRLPDMDGMEILRAARKQRPEVYIIVITGFSTVQNAVEAMKLGAFDYLSKPFGDDELVLAVERAAEKRGWWRRISPAQGAAGSVRVSQHRGGQPRMREVYDEVRRVAPLDSTVLLYGESGTGRSSLRGPSTPTADARQGSSSRSTAAPCRRDPRERAVRSHPRRLHGRRQRQGGDLRGGKRGHPVSG